MSAIRRPHGIPPTPSRQDLARLRRWRRAQLVAAGYDELSAHRLAARTELDLHAVLQRRDAGFREAHP